MKGYNDRADQHSREFLGQSNHPLAAAAGDPFLTTGLARAWKARNHGIWVPNHIYNAIVGS